MRKLERSSDSFKHNKENILEKRLQIENECGVKCAILSRDSCGIRVRGSVRMGEILRNWIQARLGILMDLTPDVFGHYTRDGTLLAQILHSYDIINRSQLDTIIHTADPALCRVNLKHLRFWLRFVGVEFDDEGIDEISCGKGTRSLRLFYKLYLCLETKDRLHFITLQREREKYVPTSKKFQVSRVSEQPPPYQPRDHPLAKKLGKEGSIVGRGSSGIPLILRKIRRERQSGYPRPDRTARCQPEVDTNRQVQR